MITVQTFESTWNAQAEEFSKWDTLSHQEQLEWAAKIANSLYDVAVKCRDAGKELTKDEIHLCRQWFGVVEDLNPKYLTPVDYKLAQKLYEKLGMRVPDSVINMAREKESEGNGSDVADDIGNGAQ